MEETVNYDVRMLVFVDDTGKNMRSTYRRMIRLRVSRNTSSLYIVFGLRKRVSDSRNKLGWRRCGHCSLRFSE